MALDVSDELRSSIAAYGADPVGYQQRYASVDVAALRTYFASYLPAGGRVLDAGCGTGRDVTAFAEAGFVVDGIDLCGALLDLAVKACPGATLGVSDIRHMPFDENTFDGVWAMASLVHLDHAAAEQALFEIRRVLRSHGCLFVTLKADESDTGRWEGDRWFSFWKPETARAAFEKSGFWARSMEVDEGSIGGSWINALLFAA